jgi:pyruvate dehydrogenase phosphatase
VKGAANVLIREVLERAARKKELRYKQMRRMRPNERRYFHDDISVVILFFDNLEEAAPSAENVVEEGPDASGRANSMPVR